MSKGTKKAWFTIQRRGFLALLFISAAFLLIWSQCQIKEESKMGQKNEIASSEIQENEAIFSEDTPQIKTKPSKETIRAIQEEQAIEVILRESKDEGEAVLVTRVIDGDTIEIEGGQRVRYIGIDTPETVDPRKLIQCFGKEASNRNRELVEGKRVRLEKDVSETDKYGRLVRYVHAGDIFVNLVLVQEGFAYSYAYPPDVKYQSQFIEAQRIAREQKKGLWDSCPASSPLISTPSSMPVSTPPSAGCNIKGNINSKGEKIYHLAGCDSYAKTKIDEGRGERWFCGEEEAAAAGWRKAKNCPL